jgi:hypothetical protein
MGLGASKQAGTPVNKQANQQPLPANAQGLRANQQPLGVQPATNGAAKGGRRGRRRQTKSKSKRTNKKRK